MNATADQKIIPLSPNDSTHNGARAVESTRLPRPHEPRTYRPPATSISDDTMLTTQIDSATDESSRPLEPEIAEEAAEPDQRWALLGAVGRVAAAVGAATFVALLFVIVIPSLRQQSNDASASASSAASTAAAIESLKAAMAKSEQAAKLREAQAAQPSPPVAAPSTDSQPVRHDQSETLLRQFMQWQQKPADAQDEK